jgi:hypothetical protein
LFFLAAYKEQEKNRRDKGRREWRSFLLHHTCFSALRYQCSIASYCDASRYTRTLSVKKTNIMQGMVLTH